MELTGGNLARHLRVLADAGYVKATKAVEGKRPRTWASVTKKGRTAFYAEVQALRALLDRVDAHPPAGP